MGIHPDFLPHIFESFRQEDTSVTRKFGGLGLGLAIVRYLVEAHGGTIAADSPGEGLGSTFTVRLPLSPASPRSIPSNLPPPDAADLSGIRILVVDDNSDTLDVIEVALAQFGAEVNAYATATAALADLEQLSPHILICDIGMPEMDGYSLIEKIRSLPSKQISQVPAIALTAYARDEERQKALNHGFQQHMAKPFNPNQLAAAVADLYANLREP
jgi:CheY-like chemotaxis protein